MSDQIHIDADVQPDPAPEADHNLLDQLAGLVDLGGDAPVAPGMPGMPDGGDAGMPVAPGGDAGPVDAGPVDAPMDGGPEVHLPVDGGDPAPVDPAPVDPAPVDPAPVDLGGDPAPVDPAPVDPAPVDPAPVDLGGDPAPVDPAPVDPAPVDPAPVDPAPVDPAPVDGGAGHDPAPLPPVIGDHDGTPPPSDTGDHTGEDTPTQPVDDHNATSGDPAPDQGHAGLPTDDSSHTPDPVHVDPISLPVMDGPHELPSTVSDAVPPSADLHTITGSLTTALGATPTPVPDFHLSAPTADAATLLVPDSPELPTMHVTDVDHAAGTVTAAPVGMPGAPSMTLPLDQVQAAHEESGSPALSFATGGAAGALTSLTVVALAARKLRKA